MVKTLSLSDSNVFKGFAILLMLWHHLFYNCQELFDEFLFLNYNVIEYTRVMAKLCVSIFVFISSYGLTIQAEKRGIKSLKKFYIHRFAKLYLNYWFIWLLFVPISIFYFKYTLETAYGTNIVPKLILDLLGLINCTGAQSYNPTWWFYSCIILLYWGFPFLYKLAKKDMLFAVMTCICIKHLPFDFLDPIRNYIYVFITGIAFVLHSPDKGNISSTLKWVVLLITMLFVRNSVGQLADCVITCCLVVLYINTNISECIKKTMAFLGKHSMNMFLFHTFIYQFWFMPQIYYFRNPIIIFIELLIICLILSIILEYLKKTILFDRFVRIFN